ncbi:MAG: hypothetical protein EU529_12160 [Promethearchaeota archaeon]|nr:MAG: hypothetical protein EU529_12160 [Candidatus Lokiarchaeota archaeon]
MVSPKASLENIGCQNRFIIQKDAEKVLENFIKYWDRSGFHRTLIQGDHKRKLKNLAKLIGMDYVEEDKD